MNWVAPLRLFHSSVCLRSALASTNKNLLSQLRKATGYSISHCKKALELHQNDYDEASKWLAAQAQAEGWAKATKLSGRSTSQGQLGLTINHDNTRAAMLEINCETDFVARNNVFVELATELTEACLAASSTATASSSPVIQKELWSKEQVSQIKHTDGTPLADKVALSIGLLGENILLNRAIKVCTSDKKVELYGYTHPAPSSNAVAGGGHESTTLLGRFGAVVAVRSLSDQPADHNVLKLLCLQVIGMKPEFIGTPEDVEKHGFNSEADVEDKEHTQSQDQAPVMKDKTDKDKFLLKQEWLDDDEYTVEEVLGNAGLEVIDFVRMEVGQQSEAGN